MAEPTKKDRFGATPRKLVLVGVLAAILIGVIAVQSGQPTPPGSQPAAERSSRSSPRAKAEGNAGEALAEAAVGVSLQKRPPWPEILLADVTRHDPFARPKWMVVAAPGGELARRPSAAPEMEKRRQREVINRLRSEGVDMIVVGERGAIAVIGSEKLAVGDVIEGFRVSEINRDGVVLVEHDAP